MKYFTNCVLFPILGIVLLQYCLVFGEGNRAVKSIADDLLQWVFKEKCMQELGCFSNGPPFFDIKERPISLLPYDREQIATTFTLYTSDTPFPTLNFTNLNITVDQLLSTKFHPLRKTFFIVPGYISRFAPAWEEPMAFALVSAENCNVFRVDWTGGDSYWYEQSVANTRVVGAEIARLIMFLQDSLDVKPESVHIIGHSLGAHIAGYAGKRVRNLGRITGMDPAGPYFENVDPVVRLNRTDALFVDNIHTNCATNRFSGFGTTESLGHFDFFPNGGVHQPGCLNLGETVWEFIKHPTKTEKEFDDLICDHHRAVELMMSSIIGSCLLEGVICDSWESFTSGACGQCEREARNGTCVAVGLYASHYKNLLSDDSSVNVYLNTTSTRPYCL